MTSTEVLRRPPNQDGAVDRSAVGAWPSRRATVGAAIAVLCLWVGVVVLSGEGYLSPDIGAKAATLEAMVREGSLRPEVPTWASTVDPEGTLQPINMVEVDGRWVAVTTLPALYLSLPLYAIGGYRLALVVPLVAGLAAAVGAGALARRLGQSPTAARRAGLVVGTAGPVVVYSLQLWEHTVGLALMTWGTVWAIDAATGRRPGRSGLLCGAAFAAAYSLRQEALVYAALAGVAVAVSSLRQQGVRRSLPTGAAMVAGLVGATVANLALEVALIGAPLRTGRSAGTLQAVDDQLAARIDVAVVTLGATVPSGDGFGRLTAGLLAAGLVALVASALRGRRLLVPAGAVAAAVVLSALYHASTGPTFVPGMVAAAPLAAAGLAAWLVGQGRGDRPVAVSMVVAVGALPLVWGVQFVEGIWPQWGARYLLTSGLVLTVLGMRALEPHRRVLAGFVAASLAVTAWGLATHLRHSHGWEPLTDHVAAQDGVVVFDNRFLAQQMGTMVLDRPWLSAPTPEHRARAAELLRRGSIERFRFVTSADGEPAFPGFAVMDRSEVEAMGYTFRSYALEPASRH